MVWRVLLLLAALVSSGCGLDVVVDDTAGDDDFTEADDDDTTPTDDDDATPTDDDDSGAGDDDDSGAGDDDDSGSGDDDDSGVGDDDDSGVGDDDDSGAGDDDDTAPTGPDCVTDFWTCNHPSQCVEVFADCCGCANGGANIAINGACTTQWEALVESLFGPCAGVGCLAVYMCDGSVPRCEGGVCTYRP